MAKIFHCIKFAFGFTLLAIFSVYWESYREIDVSSPSQQTNFELVVGTPPSSFAGWELLAYSFATMPTAEGTIKKCVMRVLGTCCGGLSAWLLILAVGDNPYGTVAWLTGTAALGILLSVEKDESARFGQSRDFGYAGFYFVLTQSVIVFDFRVGLGSRNELVANRIAANLLGIGMACVLAMIPPRVLGARPEYADQLLTKISQSLDQTMLLAIDEAPSEKYTELRITHEEEASLLYSTATYLLEDANRLSKFPIFKVDHQLEELMLELVTTSCILSIWWDYIARLISEDEKTSHKWQTAFKAVFELSLHVCVTPKTDVTGSVLDEEHRFLANAFAVVKRRLETHARVIKQIREVS